jgi:hypothetical protein
MTRQETFNEVVGHMRTMSTPCKTLEGDNWVGKYYNSNGEPGCAVGVLIPPSKYKAEMENTPACKGLVEVVLKEEGHDPFLCYFLQMIHDCHPTEYWEANLKHLAMKLGLDYFPQRWYQESTSSVRSKTSGQVLITISPQQIST